MPRWKAGESTAAHMGPGDGPTYAMVMARPIGACPSGVVAARNPGRLVADAGPRMHAQKEPQARASNWAQGLAHLELQRMIQRSEGRFVQAADQLSYSNLSPASTASTRK